VLLGALSSVLYGLGDFLGGEGAKRVSAATVVLWAGVISLPLILVASIVVGGDPAVSDLAWGVAAGASGAFGLVFLFTGLGRGQAAAVAPAAAALSAIVPVAISLVLGETLTTGAWTGVLIAIPAIVLCSWVPDPGEVALGGLWYGLAAGAGFGGYLVLIDMTSQASGLYPLVPARTSTVAVVLLLALAKVWGLSGFAGSPRGLIVGNGVLDVAGNVTLLLGLRTGNLVAVVIAASFYPAVTVLLARVVNGERLWRRQLVGVALTLVALVAISLA
jgi:drug/metabolite transporter (DMT)-like permease